jgi:tRNA nucleotidyltransferase (CCA-adding enzyme)
MDIYLVGGAVRDKMLNLPVDERDWVVVGATPDTLTKQGYRSVGKDFPVFLHPQSKEEYALARTERKSAAGHRGFVCDANELVTLEQDLARRDLTINAIAESPTGELIDPYGGTDDLQAKVLRHVSPAFVEDPLRILRVARFLARFEPLGFTVAPETMTLMQSMINDGAISELTPERVFMECEKALKALAPAAFFKLLAELGASQFLWPEIKDTARLAHISQRTTKPELRFATLFVNVPETIATKRCRSLKAPNRYTELVALVCRGYATWLKLEVLDAAAILDHFYRLDAFRRNERYGQFSEICTLLAQDDADAPRTDFSIWNYLYQQVASISAADVAPDLQGPAISAAIKDLQRETITTIVTNSAR